MSLCHHLELWKTCPWHRFSFFLTSMLKTCRMDWPDSVGLASRSRSSQLPSATGL
jgi:hypothetical protein